MLQAIDYGEEKFGKRVEGLSSAVNGLYAQIGAGLAAVLVGGLMGALDILILVTVHFSISRISFRRKHFRVRVLV